MKIEAYKCTECNSLHQLKKDATSCIRKCRAEAKKKTKESEKAAALIALRNYARLNATSIPHFAKLVSAAGKELFGGEFAIAFRVKYYEHVSNSHDNPIGGVQNWCARDKDVPTGYPGFQGDFTLVTKGCKKIGFWETEYFNKWHGIAGINTCNSTVKLFLQDFPLIEANISQYKTLQEKAKIDTDELSESLKTSIATDDTIKLYHTTMEALHEKYRKTCEELKETKIALEAHVSLNYRDSIIEQKNVISDGLKDWALLNIGVML